MQINEWRINRICRMESFFDTVNNALQSDTECIFNNTVIISMLNELKQYLSGGKWLEDYEADERGELPSDLKRGVLSQDALYNLLCEIEQRTYDLL